MFEVHKKQQVKTGDLQGQIKENQCFYQNVQCVIVRYRYISKGQKPFGY